MDTQHVIFNDMLSGVRSRCSYVFFLIISTEWTLCSYLDADFALVSHWV